jgi:hypothetical protein
MLNKNNSVKFILYSVMLVYKSSRKNYVIIKVFYGLINFTHQALKSKNKDWMAQNQESMS